MTYDDLPQLQHFDKHVEHELGLECEWSWHDRVGVVHDDNSKGKRLTKRVETQGWSMENVVAFGDNFNDISILEVVGTDVAIGNADDTIKAYTNIVIGDSAINSIAQFIYSHLI